MSTVDVLWAVVAVALSSLVVTGLARRYALRYRLLDIPNARSSHDRPTPRGGGVAIVAAFLSAVLWLGWREALDAPLVWALGGGGVLVAGIGWVDDHRPLDAGWRLLVHVLAAAWAVYWLGGLPSVDLGIGRMPLGGAGAVLAVAGVVWLTNLYNFMDGIDGLAASEAAYAAAAGGTLLYASGAQGLALAAWLLGVASLGFLYWNWPPAKIFMGDVGSGLLGYTFAVLALAGERQGVVPIAVWVILLMLFIGDATFTLLRRIHEREPWYTAHRSHAYQQLIQGGYSHGQVTLGALVANFVVLWPLAGIAWWIPALLPVMLALSLAVAGLLWAEAGRRKVR